MKIRITIITTWICLSFCAFPQRGYDEDNETTYKFIEISFASGGFFAHRHPANYYNGNPKNVNNISYPFKNEQWKDDVVERLNGRDFWIVPNEDLPAKMKYKMTTPMSFRVAMNLSAYSKVFLNVSQLNLVAADIFVIRVEDGANFEPNRIQCKIWGRESRTMMDIGFQWTEDLKTRNLQWFYELAFNITNTKVKENSIEIEGLEQSLMNQGTYVAGQGFVSEPLPETAFGVGIAGSFGWKYNITSYASADVGATAYLQDINLTGYKKFHPNLNLFVRLNLLMF